MSTLDTFNISRNFYADLGKMLQIRSQIYKKALKEYKNIASAYYLQVAIEMSNLTLLKSARK